VIAIDAITPTSEQASFCYARSEMRGNWHVSGEAAFFALAAWLVGGGCGGTADAGQASNTGPSTQTLVDELCADFREAACGDAQDEQQCLVDLAEEQDLAVAEGCQTRLDAYLKCATAGTIGCSAIEGEPLEPEVDSQCSELHATFWECVTRVPAECGVGYGAGADGVSCGVTCPEFSSKCQGPSQFGPLECICETGPHAGTTFAASDCSRGLIMATGHTCS